MINVYFLLVLFSELIASTSQVLLKLGAKREYPNFLREYLNVYVISGYSLLIGSMAIGILCYEGLGYMGVVVMEPIAYIIVRFMSRVVFKEKFGRSKIIGMVLIISGIVVFYAFG